MNMIRIRLVFMLVLLIMPAMQPEAYAGDREGNKGKRYWAWIVDMEGATRQGYLHEVSDTMLWLCPIFYNVDNCDSLKAFGASRIRTIKIRRRGAGGRGFGYGVLTGATFGALIGAGRSSESDWNVFSGSERALIGALVYAIPGGLFGVLIGSLKRKFNIDGGPEVLRMRRAGLQNFARIKHE